MSGAGKLMKSAFASVAFSLFDKDVSHTKCDFKFDSAAIGELFEIIRSRYKKGSPVTALSSSPLTRYKKPSLSITRASRVSMSCKLSA
jgi:hypothetical protein